MYVINDFLCTLKMLFGTECDIRMDFDTNEYPNIFLSRKWHERISEYIRAYDIFWHVWQEKRTECDIRMDV